MLYSSDSFEAFLRDCLDNGHTQVRLVPRISDPAGVTFYAHGQCGLESSEMFEGSVYGNDIGVIEEPEAIPVEREVLADEELDDLAFSETGVADVGAVLDAEEVKAAAAE